MNKELLSIEKLASSIQRLQDIESIKRLMITYSRASDEKHVEGALEKNIDIFVSLFTEDAIFDIGSGYGRYEGREAIRKFMLGPKRLTWSLHYVISPVIDVAEDGRTARGFWYLWEIAKIPDPKTGEEEALWIGGTYDNELVKQDDGQWKFNRVTLKMQIMSPYPEGWAKKPWHDFGRPIHPK